MNDSVDAYYVHFVAENVMAKYYTAVIYRNDKITFSEVGRWYYGNDALASTMAKAFTVSGTVNFNKEMVAGRTAKVAMNANVATFIFGEEGAVSVMAA